MSTTTTTTPAPCLANFCYTGSGTITIRGCAWYLLIPRYYHRWRIGDVCFVKQTAKKGKLEKVVIKRVRVVNNLNTINQVTFLYEDTLNGLYNEYDLLTEIEALNTAKEYYERQIYWKIRANKPCNRWGDPWPP